MTTQRVQYLYVVKYILYIYSIIYYGNLRYSEMKRFRHALLK